MRASDIPEISRLSLPEKILLVEDLWDERKSLLTTLSYLSYPLRATWRNWIKGLKDIDLLQVPFYLLRNFV